MNFEPGQWYWTSTDQRAEIIGIDVVFSDHASIEVVAYRYEGRKTVHMRIPSELSLWRLKRPLEVGDEIRHRTVVDGVRVGCAERKTITYASDHLVCFDVFTSDGEFCAEISWKRAEFDEEFEVVPE